MSESFRLGAVLALTGGFLDAYTYLIRGGVFANAQTGNIVLLGVRLMEGDWGGAGHYLVPILAFAAGVLAAELIRGRFRGQALHWRQITVAAELLLLAVTSSCLRRATRPMCWWPLSARSRWASARSTAMPCHHYVRKPAQRHGAAVPMGKTGERDHGHRAAQYTALSCFHRRSGTGGLVQRPVGAEGGVGGMCSFWRPFCLCSAQTPCENGQGYKIKPLNNLNQNGRHTEIWESGQGL
ncbi:MAG: YoaK family protein [Lawsonibacter sp.]